MQFILKNIDRLGPGPKVDQKNSNKKEEEKLVIKKEEKNYLHGLIHDYFLLERQIKILLLGSYPTLDAWY